MVRRIRELQEAMETRLTEHLLAEQAGDSTGDSVERKGDDPNTAWVASIAVVRAEVTAALDEIDRLVPDAVELFLSVDGSLRPIAADSGSSRLERARFSAEFGPRALQMERQAAEVFGHALDADVQLRRLRSDAIGSAREESVAVLQKEIRDRARSIEMTMGALVPVTSVSNRLRGPGLRAVSGPVGQLVQSMRDVALLIDRWGA
jgi:hypothetical protein